MHIILYTVKSQRCFLYMFAGKLKIRKPLKINFTVFGVSFYCMLKTRTIIYASLPGQCMGKALGNWRVKGSANEKNIVWEPLCWCVVRSTDTCTCAPKHTHTRVLHTHYKTRLGPLITQVNPRGRLADGTSVFLEYNGRCAIIIKLWRFEKLHNVNTLLQR